MARLRRRYRGCDGAISGWLGLRAYLLDYVGRERVESADAVLQQEPTQIDQSPQAFRDAVGHTGDHDASKAVADKNDVFQCFKGQDIDDIVDEGMQRNAVVKQMAALAQAGEGRGVDAMSL